MTKKKLWSFIKVALKIFITGFSLWWVFRKIDIRELIEAFKSTNGWFLFVAALFFILSKVIASFRLNLFFRAIQLQLSELINLRLYWLGMFYNLFLPGGIGGDGYKVWWLNAKFETPAKKLLWAVLLDRISGLAALGILICLIALFLPVLNHWDWLISLTAILGLVIFYLIYHFFFKEFKACFWSTNIQGLLVQLAQLAAVIFILNSLGIENHYKEYLMLFLVSSVVAVLPFTIGGLGARELVFLFGSQYLQLDMHYAVTISLWFYLITATVSLFGAYYVFNEKKLELSEGPVG
ncbi:lysylphosphatidylglycerol synthase transmembrane domain-containing protein [Solitalea koreensis]|uniref:Lysylphosphatidylglycerol synthase TM region n=1 Tax=Solitalea koreensis TaxID=543615 RepID=A0A521C9C6_9SPHI|nr:lysylphosphatidylglycerol synthase transmembrane domain-containing protein [Solitalea koreensis]SMO56049.1 hypothetical protein SAMN06265350_103310 [Solitalea koreensis]